MINFKRFGMSLFIVSICLSSNAYSALFGPSNYDECIIDSMKGVMSDIAARAIKQSCRDKYNPTPESRDITDIVRAKITEAKGGFYISSHDGLAAFNVQLYNGSDYYITGMVVKLVYKNNERKIVIKNYKTYDFAPPLTNSSLNYYINQAYKPEYISWDIQSISGYKN